MTFASDIRSPLSALRPQIDHDLAPHLCTSTHSVRHDRSWRIPTLVCPAVATPCGCSHLKRFSCAMESPASTPLADYFWIAGVDSITYQEPLQPQQTQQVDETIDEMGEPELETSRNSVASRTPNRHSRQSSGNRLSKLSLDKRFSIHTLEDLDDNTRSNRSSTTIKAPPQSLQSATSVSSAATATQENSSNGGTSDTAGPANRDDFDFDQMLVKFAVERENFLEDLSFSAGAKLHSRPPMISPRAEIIKAEESELSGRRSPLRGIKGSIRRKLSFRDMNSIRKPHSTARAGRMALG